MGERYDLILRGGRLATPGGIAEGDIAVSGGRIAAIGALSGADAAEVVDASGLHVLPGVIDTQVHFREPGMTHKEDIEAGTRGAVLGGVTAVFEMPNTNPTTSDAAALRDKLDKAARTAWCDHAFFLGATDSNSMLLGELENSPGCCGIKIFMGSSHGSLLVSEDEAVLDVLRNGRRPVSIHAEDEARLVERRAIAVEAGRPHAHPEWRDVESALKATRRVVALARRAGRPVHVLHVTSAEEMAFLGRNKDIATVETTPQHLTLSAPECYDRLGTRAQMNPPVREGRHREALWKAVNEGVVDLLGSDHAPHTLEEKAKPYPESPSGMPGVQTLLPVMLNHVAEGRLSLERLVELTAYGPQRVFRIAGKGRIAVGYDADFVLVDTKARRTITSAWMANKAGWTPFDGMQVTGWPMATILRGRFVMREDEVLGRQAGEPVRFWDATRPEG